MKLNELKKVARLQEMPLGTNEVIFDHIDYRTDKETEDINGIFIHVKDYKPLFIPFFDNGQNFQLDFLLDQLEVESYDPDDINKKTGTSIIAHRYQRQVETETYTNVSFNKNYTNKETTFA